MKPPELFLERHFKLSYFFSIIVKSEVPNMSEILKAISAFLLLPPEGQIGLIALAGLGVAAYAIYVVSTTHRRR
ncbi:hypothetical protein [Mesorhizobium sp. M0213]|uniref:hypothetical protein n=1 Tax=unclassified Mesorhizobium TaxID=325217 RepID=UPI00333C7430